MTQWVFCSCNMLITLSLCLTISRWYCDQSENIETSNRFPRNHRAPFYTLCSWLGVRYSYVPLEITVLWVSIGHKTHSINSGSFRTSQIHGWIVILCIFFVYALIYIQFPPAIMLSPIKIACEFRTRNERLMRWTCANKLKEKGATHIASGVTSPNSAFLFLFLCFLRVLLRMLKRKRLFHKSLTSEIFV